MQARHTAPEEGRGLFEDVQSGEGFDPVAFAEEFLDLLGMDGKGRTWPLVLGVFKADEQGGDRRWHQRGELVGVSPTHLGRKGDEGCPVEQRADAGQVLGREIEKVTAQDAEFVDLILAKGRGVGDEGRQALFAEHLLNGGFDQFDADHPVSLADQPQEIPCLPAQWDENRGLPIHAQAGPVFLKVGVDFLLVPTDLAALPAVVPEIGCHGSCHSK